MNGADAARRRRWALVLLWVIPALWSSNYIIARAAVGVVPPHVLAFGRWLLAFLLFLPMTWRTLRDRFGQWRHEWRQMLVLGALGMWICGAYVYVAGHTTSATNIGLIYATTPVGVAVVASRMSKVPIPGAHWAGMLLALAGVMFVVAHGDSGVLLSVRFTAGDLWIVVTSASWVAYSVLNAHWRSVLGPAPRLACITAGGLLILLPFAAWEVASQHYVPGGRALLLIAAAGLLPGFLSYLAYSFMLRELGAPKAALQTYLSPIYAALSAWWLLGEPPHWYHLVGGVLILPSIYFATRRRRLG